MNNIVSISEDLPTSHDSLDPTTPEGFEQLVLDHHRELLTYAYALSKNLQVAREIVQDGFITAYEKMETFDVTRDFPAWMRGIVRNKMREYHRRNRLRELPESIVASIDADIAAWQEARLRGSGSVFEALEGCLDRLPENLKTAVDAVYYAHDSGEEAADRLDISPAALRKRLQRARDLLRGCIEGKLESNQP